MSTRLILVALAVFVLIRALWRLMGGVIEGLSGKSPDSRMPQSGVQMVRDPVCGTFVVPAKALTVGQGANMHFFCSEKCRRAWQVKPAPPWPSK